jgi:signal transduction histidine kinase
MSCSVTVGIGPAPWARAARVVAIATAVVVVAAFIGSLVLDAAFRTHGRDDLTSTWGADAAFGLAILVSAVVAIVLLVRRPDHPVGWLFAGLSTSIAVSGFLESYGLFGLVVDPGSVPGAEAAAVVSSVLFISWLTLIGLVFSLTPDGRYLSPRWRRASHVMVAAGVVWFLMKLFGSGPLEHPFEHFDNPWAITSAVSPLRALAAVTNNVLVLVAAISLTVRFRRSRGDDRRQLLWVVVAAVPCCAFVALAFAAASAGNDALVNVAAVGFVVVLPVGVALAVTRYHLYDVDRILSRAVTYLVVTALVVGMYMAVVLLVARTIGQAANRSPTATTLATLAAAAAARPVYIAVRDAIDRRFLRRRYDALQQVRAFVAEPTRHRSVETVLRDALLAPELRVSYWVDNRSQWVSEDGHIASVGDHPLTITRGGRVVASVDGVAAGDPVVQAVVEEAGPELDNASLRAAVAVQLEEVRASRERIAEAHLDERHRIERDLHDGAQQRLLGSAAQMQAALLNGEPSRLRSALELGVQECRSAVEELRALANGLHPSVLADGGLSAALDDLASRWSVSVVVDRRERRYPELVEATIWFVACEGVANAIKHASPTTVEVRLEDHGCELCLFVDDDGRGGADPLGNGLRGLADRVEAAGGHLDVKAQPDGGTRLEAVVPCGS